MMEHKGTRAIETQRLILRRFAPGDAEPMFANWAGDDEVTKYLRWETHRSVEETENIVAGWVKSYGSPSYYHWTITLKDCGTPIGSIGAFSVSERDFSCEIGYCIGRAFWHNGYASEAAKAVIHYMLYDVGLNRVEAWHSVGNQASGRVMQKAGMTLEGTARQKYLCRLGFQDSRMYGIVKSDFYHPAENLEFADTGTITDGEMKLICKAVNPAIPEKHYVPSYDYEIRIGRKAAGRITLRIGFTPALYYGGQIGYGVNEAFRGHGYAARACRLLAPLARQHGYKQILIANSPENIASRRTCEKIGAKLVRIADLPEWHDLYRQGNRRECIWEWDLTK